MAGLMMVFLFISISYAFQVTQQAIELEQKSEKIAKIVEQYNDDRALIYNSLMSKFGDRLDEWKATIDQDTLTLRFNDPALLFKPGSSELTQRFAIILSEFWIDYTEILVSYSASIREVKIEGHTSSEWANVTIEESYFNNMRLSQERTTSTLFQCYQLTPKRLRKWVRSFVTANGMSFSRRILDSQGNEDLDRSRRVEFTIVVDSKSTLDELKGELK
jgi:outer membrane protein OmpA-like peptidoglycan-associated protein